MSFDSVEKSQASGTPWEIFRFVTAGQNFFLTSADVNISYLGQTYISTTLRRDEMSENADVDSGEIKVYLPSAHPLALLFLPGLPPSPVQLTIFAGHYTDTEVVVLYSGSVASGVFVDECELTCRSDKYILNRKVPRELYQGLCNHIFGDSGCGINLAGYTTAGVVSVIDSTGSLITVPAFAGLPNSLKAGYFIQGNSTRAILNQTGATIVLMAPIAGLVVGAACSAVAGCAHTYPACSGFNNVQNFAGFDLVPLINPFDGVTSLA
jgi:hypothetical protein